MWNSRVLLLVALLSCACTRKRDERLPVAVKVEVASASPRLAAFRYSGVVAAHRQVELAFRVPGYVESLANVEAIAPGASNEDGLAEGRREESSSKPTRRIARSVQAGDRVASGSVLASLRLADFKHRMSELSAMEAEVSASQRMARADLERSKRLLSEGAISQAAYDTAKTRYDALSGGEGAAAARVRQAGLTLSDAQLKAPFDGVVLERRIEVGGLVAPGVPAFVVADTSMVKVTFGVPDTVQPHLALGQEITLTTDVYPNRTFTGLITKISAQADPQTRVFEIEATFDNANGWLKIGIVTQVQVGKNSETTSAPPPEEILVPLSSIVRIAPFEQGFWTYVVADEGAGPVAMERPVELGPLVGNRVAVTRGLRAGERVVVQGTPFLVHGQRVNVVPGAVAYSSPPSQEPR